VKRRSDVRLNVTVLSGYRQPVLLVKKHGESTALRRHAPRLEVLLKPVVSSVLRATLSAIAIGPESHSQIWYADARSGIVGA
jgi:hypothetical protein